MAKKYLRIGSMVDVVGYDDADYDSAIETDAPIKAGAPVDANDVLRLGDASGGDVEGPAGATDEAIARFDTGTGKLLQNSTVTISDGGNVNMPNNAIISINSIQVVKGQEAAEADLAAVPDCTGGDTIDQAVLESYLGDIRTKMNNLLAKLRSHGLIDT